MGTDPGGFKGTDPGDLIWGQTPGVLGGQTPGLFNWGQTPGYFVDFALSFVYNLWRGEK